MDSTDSMDVMDPWGRVHLESAHVHLDIWRAQKRSGEDTHSFVKAES